MTDYWMRLSGLQKCDKLHVFDIVEEMKRKHFFYWIRNKIYEAKVNSFCMCKSILEMCFCVSISHQYCMVEVFFLILLF